MRTIRGKRALVTGAASGIGRAIALRLADEGCNLYLLDINEENLAEVAADCRSRGVETVAARCDVSRTDEITRVNAEMLSHWGKLDILVNNAGVAYYGPTENMTAEQWDWLLKINLLAPIQFTRELLPALKAQPEAHIVNMASMWGLVGMGRFTAYNVSKFALVGFSESLRAEFDRQGLGVTAVCPGFVRTKLFEEAPCGHPKRRTPVPHRVFSTTPERVAQRVVRAIYRDQRLVVITPLAHLLYYTKRFAPGLIDALQRMGRRRRMSKKTDTPVATPVADQRHAA
jgi:NAD(P)-dependent dehydrogenase (short-subunit alcohol dehydrogenase family)